MNGKIRLDNGKMGFVMRELDRIAVGASGAAAPEAYCELYAAQQALSWAIDPQNFAGPVETILADLVTPLNTPAD